MTLNVICLKFGKAYGSEYVNRLRLAIRRNTARPLRLLCMTDDPRGIDKDVEILALPQEPYAARMIAAMSKARVQGRLQKISLFKPDLVPDLDGPLIVLDLDIVVVGDLAELADFAPGKVCLRREWNAQPWQLGHGSVEKFEPKLHAYLYEDMLQDPEGSVALGGGSEQNYTSLNAERHGDFAPFPDEWIASFKRDCRPVRPLNLIVPPRLPPAAKVVCFHGNPKMSEALGGYRAGPFKSTRKAEWLTRAWSDD